VYLGKVTLCRMVSQVVRWLPRSNEHQAVLGMMAFAPVRPKRSMPLVTCHCYPVKHVSLRRDPRCDEMSSPNF
jgi:hypothetical protein